MLLCHEDGTPHKTQKFVLVELIKSNSTQDEVPRRFDAVIFDGFYLLHTMKNIPQTFVLGNNDIIENNKEIFVILEKFVCHMYGMKDERVNDARYEKFLATYKTSGTKIFTKKIINYDSSNLPSYQSELQQQLLRALYITNIWRNSHSKNPTILSPEHYGWNLNNNKYDFNWFEGDTVPSSIYEILSQQPIDTDENESDEPEEHNA
ncbi:hypothetical protein PV327_011371, partial [Microctonus hyperodae]